MLISIEQIKAARAMLGIAAAQLVKTSGVGRTTIRRYEMGITVGEPLINPGVFLNINKKSK